MFTIPRSYAEALRPEVSISVGSCGSAPSTQSGTGRPAATARHTSLP